MDMYVIFLSEMVPALFCESHWKKVCCKENSQQYLFSGLEAFGILIYDNNYKGWWRQYKLHVVGNEEEELSGISEGTVTSKYTMYGNTGVGGGGKGVIRHGWNQLGVDRYNLLIKVLDHQRNI